MFLVSIYVQLCFFRISEISRLNQQLTVMISLPQNPCGRSIKRLEHFKCCISAPQTFRTWTLYTKWYQSRIRANLFSPSTLNQLCKRGIPWEAGLNWPTQVCNSDSVKNRTGLFGSIYTMSALKGDLEIWTAFNCEKTLQDTFIATLWSLDV